MGIEFLTSGSTTGSGVSNPVSTSQGGTGVNAGASTGIPQINAGVGSVATLSFTSALLTGTVPLSKGGWNSDLSSSGTQGQAGFQDSVGGTPTFRFIKPSDLIANAIQTTPDFTQFGYIDDFTGPVESATAVKYMGPGAYRAFAIGAGTTSAPFVLNHVGVHSLNSTAAVGTGYVYISGGSFLNPATYTVISTFTFQIPTLATAGEDGFCYVGYSDQVSGNELTTGNSVLIGMDRATDATHFSILTVAAGVGKVRAATATTMTAATWYTAKVVMNSSGTTQFFIAPLGGAYAEVTGSPVSAANSPTSAVNIGVAMMAHKTVGTVNTIALQLDENALSVTGLTR